MRIKSIWESFARKRDQALLPEQSTELTLDALPDEYAGNATQLMERVSCAIEQLTIEAYAQGQRLFEKRLKTLEQSHQEKIRFYTDSEASADESIKRLENELGEAQKELQQLADQNAKLLIENSEFRGRLAVFDERYKSSSDKQPAQA